MIYIKTFENHSSSYITINKGTELFHSTIAKFDVSNLRGGYYDNIIWTTRDSGISQTYIPESGMLTYANTDEFIKPPNRGRGNLPSYTNIIGLTFRDISYHYGNLVSFSYPREFQYLSKKSNNISKQLTEKELELSDYEKRLTDFSNSDIDYIIKNKDKFKKLQEDYNKLRSERDNLRELYNESDIKKHLRNYVNNYLSEKGYSPSNDYSLNNNYSYTLKTTYVDNEQILLSSDHRDKGRLIILTPKVDLKIFDARQSHEGDLTNLEYHNISLFREIENNTKYDGIYINDFAQTSEGNLGHTSIGLFKRTISKMGIEIIEDVESPDPSELRRMRDIGEWQSKEYLNR